MNIVFEGIDGSGKDTQLEILKRSLEATGASVSVVKHPGYTKFGEAVRELILHGPGPSDLARRVLFLAEALNAIEHVEGDIVLWNRHLLYSNMCYGLASGTDFNQLKEIDEIYTRWTTFSPDVVLVFDIPARKAFERIHKRGETLTSVEQKGVEFMEQVRQNYLSLPGVKVIPNFVDGQELGIIEIAALVQEAVGV